jgi:hypothetical protein
LQTIADLDRSLLRDLAEQLDDGAFDMDLTGFDNQALEELMTATAPEFDAATENQTRRIITCPACGKEFNG